VSANEYFSIWKHFHKESLYAGHAALKGPIDCSVTMYSDDKTVIRVRAEAEYKYVIVLEDFKTVDREIFEGRIVCDEARIEIAVRHQSRYLRDSGPVDRAEQATDENSIMAVNFYRIHFSVGPRLLIEISVLYARYIHASELTHRRVIQQCEIPSNYYFAVPLKCKIRYNQVDFSGKVPNLGRNDLSTAHMSLAWEVTMKKERSAAMSITRVVLALSIFLKANSRV
jgi:hypothetical protein